MTRANFTIISRGVKSLIQPFGSINSKMLVVSNNFSKFKADCDEAYIQRIVDEAMLQIQHQNSIPPILSWPNGSIKLLVNPKFHIQPISNYINLDDFLIYTNDNTPIYFWVGAALSLLLCVNHEFIFKPFDLQIIKYDALLKTITNAFIDLVKSIGILGSKLKTLLINGEFI